MFQVGDLVVYGMEGVCRVERTEKLRVGGKLCRYYVLSPVYREGATVYVPAENEELTARMKRILSPEELEALLDGAREDEPLWLDDANERRTLYAKVLLSGDRRALMRLVRTLHLRRTKLVSQGKYLRSGDDQVLRDAERMLNGEFALILNIPQQEVPGYVRTRLEPLTL